MRDIFPFRLRLQFFLGGVTYDPPQRNDAERRGRTRQQQAACAISTTFCSANGSARLAWHASRGNEVIVFVLEPSNSSRVFGNGCCVPILLTSANHYMQIARAVRVAFIRRNSITPIQVSIIIVVLPRRSQSRISNSRDFCSPEFLSHR